MPEEFKTPLTFEAFQKALKNFSDDIKSEINGKTQTEIRSAKDDLRTEIHVARNDLEQRLESGLTRVESKIDNLDKAVTHVVMKEQAQKLEDHEKHIKNLEAAVSS